MSAEINASRRTFLKVSAAAGEVCLDADVPVNRADFGLTYSPLRMASLNNTITIHAVFTRQ